MTATNTDVPPPDAYEEQLPVVSRLLAGPARNKREYTPDDSEIVAAYDNVDESGIVLLPMEDATDGSASEGVSEQPKVKRSARRCKWYVIIDFASPHSLLGVTISLVVPPTYVRVMEVDVDVTVVSSPADPQTYV